MLKPFIDSRSSNVGGYGGRGAQTHTRVYDCPARRRYVLTRDGLTLVDAPRLFIGLTLWDDSSDYCFTMGRICNDAPPSLDSPVAFLRGMFSNIYGWGVCMGTTPLDLVCSDPVTAFWNSTFDHVKPTVPSTTEVYGTLRSVLVPDLLVLDGE